MMDMTVFQTSATARKSHLENKESVGRQAGPPQYKEPLLFHSAVHQPSCTATAPQDYDCYFLKFSIGGDRPGHHQRWHCQISGFRLWGSISSPGASAFSGQDNMGGPTEIL
ncbi:hypothetical protein ANANG_G00306120 [Anguilla anguilla]|uniref:Uncharacterized protein n=1 Tax=Anguilla anguilla TaxID=7936 RepID=A0A9D3LIT9_ANGAN|nr:hypothetical protein ANANG_G00306120 [Anguilla anguilla]